MKKTLIILLSVGISIAGFSQDTSREKAREEVKSYIETAVYPVLKQQKDIYINQLNDNEKEAIEELGNARPQAGVKGKGRRGRGADRGGNLQQSKIDRSEKIAAITQAHPELNEKYIALINTYKQKWIADIEEIHGNYNIEAIKNNDGERGFDVFFNKMSNPDFLLMWDPERPMTRSKKKVGSRSGSKTQNINSELRTEMKAYVMTDVIPVISEERTSFDSNLSDAEKEIIETARQKIQVRKAMFKSWYESEDFVPGQRAKDSNFDGMREDMRKSMEEVREIALNHKDELKVSMKSISKNKDKWRSEFIKIAEKHGKDRDSFNHGYLNKMHKVKSPVQFLLFDPNKTDKSEYLSDNSSIKVIIYPNPIVNNATIAVVGAVDMNVEINIYTKNGELIKELFNSINKEERLEVKSNFDDFDTGVYIAKISYGNNEISRKLIVNK